MTNLLVTDLAHETTEQYEATATGWRCRAPFHPQRRVEQTELIVPVQLTRGSYSCLV